MKVLLVYPQCADTFWSFKYALKFISKKADLPPLGLLTVAAMLPQEWEKKLVDMNVTALIDEDLEWADYAFIGAMVVHRESVKEIIKRCKQFNTKIVAGGPVFTTEHEAFKGVDHFVLNEAEITLPLFLEDLEKCCARHIYKSDERPDVRTTPTPVWSLIDMKKYSTMSIQYSRGCPYDCEFCDIIILNGRRPRTKDTDQMLVELEAIYSHGWRGGVFVVDDNFIGNKVKLKAETLSAIIRWAEEKKYPFYFSTQVSINLADDEELMQLMVKAGFNKVFIGIETLNDESLAECNKHQNENRDLVASIRKIQNYGLQVEGGFIVGFDNDPLSIFKSQINFIQRSGIVTAMVGLLQAPRGTRLYQRLEKENRLLEEISGDHMDYSINFTPKMNRETLISGYKNILNTIYSPNHYYERVRTLLREYKPRSKRRGRIQFCHVIGFLKSMWLLGIKEKERGYYWKLLLATLVRHPRAVPLSVSLAIYGFHFRKVIEEYSKP